jgi:Fe-S-cluster containining protein
MNHPQSESFSENQKKAPTEHPDVHPAGSFLEWKHEFLTSLNTEKGSVVACGPCRGCCQSGYFIAIDAHEKSSLDAIPNALKIPSPGGPRGQVVLPFDEKGRCPMLEKSGCTIYEARPNTCRRYDCRLFAAAGITAGGADKQEINERIKQWEFSYATSADSESHAAVKAAADFIRNHSHAFPGKRIPESPSQLALAALHAYALFLPGGQAESLSEKDLAKAVIAAQPR